MADERNCRAGEVRRKAVHKDLPSRLLLSLHVQTSLGDTLGQYEVENVHITCSASWKTKLKNKTNFAH